MFYGGAAGGGKTDLLLGLGLTRHRRSIIFRREYPQLEAIVERGLELIQRSPGALYHTQQMTFSTPSGRRIRLAAVQHENDWIKYQGRGHDFKAFDEITHFTALQYRMLTTWARTTRRGQRVRVVAAGNPPIGSDGAWVIDYWGPWVNPDHPYPAPPGELRWFAYIDDVDTEVENGAPFEWKGETLYPRSRTFFPAKLDDNPILMATGYLKIVQALPEPMRSAFLGGDFRIGRTDDPFQVIPAAWVREAQARWTRVPHGPLDAVGVDVARGGGDNTVLVPRHDTWFGMPQVVPGVETPDGPSVASLVLVGIPEARLAHVRVFIDVIGVGGSPYDILREVDALDTIGVNHGRRNRHARDKSGRYPFANQRAQDWWRLREALDPVLGDSLALPPDKDLYAELVAPRWSLRTNGILIESREDIITRVGRSPDRATALILALRPDGMIDRGRHADLRVS